MDNVDKNTRSHVMAAVRARGNLSTEMRLRMLLVKRGIIGWRVLPKNIVGNPDFVFSDARLAIFVDGCFWHGCAHCYRRPSSNRDYWDAKVKRNMQRDKSLRAKLRRSGWSVLRIWEHELKENPEACIAKIERKLLQK